MAVSVSRRVVLRGLATGAAEILLWRGRAMANTCNAANSSLPSAGKAGLELTLAAVGENTLRMSLAAADVCLNEADADQSLVHTAWPSPLLQAHAEDLPEVVNWGERRIRITRDPLILRVEGADQRLAQQLQFDPNTGRVSFSFLNGPVFGLGEGLRSFDLRGTRDDMRNGQHGDNLRVYGARLPIPWLIGTGGWGLFFHQPWGTFDLTGKDGFFQPVESARGLDVFLLLGETPAEVLREWAELTGYPHLPPIWTLGYQQSHRTLASRAEVLDEAKTFREKKLPCDALIYLGTGFSPSGWNTGHGSFAFNQAVFPDPEAMLRQLHSEHFKVVLHVVNPPENLHGNVGDTAPAAQEPGDAAEYWSNHVPLERMGLDGWWPDEGDTLPLASRMARNRMYWEGGRKSHPELRPYALHRNGYAGLQRYGWLWSGDTSSTWKTLAAQVMVGINVGLCGIPYWGTDIGGFVPTEELRADLFVRWFQFSAFCPLFRGHGRTWKLRLPWGWNTGDYGPAELSPQGAAALPKPDELHNASVETICRKYLDLRYQLLPYLYAMVARTHSTGLPLMRALWVEFPEDVDARTVADAYMFGDSLLVAPVLEPAAKQRSVYLPKGKNAEKGEWWDFWTSEQVSGGKTISRPVDLQTIPLYVRAGAIMPTGPVKQYATEPSTEPLKLTVYPGADGTLSLYEDDGLTFRYEQGEYTRMLCAWSDRERTLSLRPDGGRQANRKLRIALVNGPEKEVVYEGKPLAVRL